MRPARIMIRAGTRVALAALGLAAALASPARADDTGFASIHDLALVGGKLCMSDHSHHGSGDTAATKKAAEVSAIRSWADFTVLEYGSDWGNYSLAVGKSGSCEKVSGGWRCEVDARPCRVGRGSYAAVPSKKKTARAVRSGTPSRKTAAQ